MGKRKKNLNERIVANLHGSFSADNQSFDGWVSEATLLCGQVCVAALLCEHLYVNTFTASRLFVSVSFRVVHVMCLCS